MPITQVDDGDFLGPLYKLSSQLCRMTHSSGFNLYGIGGYGNTLILYSPDSAVWDSAGQRRFEILFVVFAYRKLAVFLCDFDYSLGL